MELGITGLEILAAKLALGKLSATEIYEVADFLTNEQEDAPELLEILVEGRADESGRLASLLKEYFDRRGISVPSKEFAPIDLAYRYAKAFSEGRLEALEAARKIHWELWLGPKSCFEFGPFVYWLDEYGDGDLRRKAYALEQLQLSLRSLLTDFECANVQAWRKE